MREPVSLIQDPTEARVGVGFGGVSGSIDGFGRETLPPNNWPLLATLPALYPEWLGDRSFCERHGVRFPYVSGAMANGIATTEMVMEMARAGFMGFFGAAGLGLSQVEQALDTLQRELGDGLTWGSNLIHSPNEPDLEAAVANLYIRRGVKRVSASAYMNLTPAVVRYAYTGLRQLRNGQIDRRNHVFAKISRPEVARRFLEPAPTSMLDALVRDGLLTPEEARLGARLPVAEDFIVESDSGGHTDNQALTALFPIISSLRDEVVAEQAYTRPIRLGAAGGLGTPSAVAAAFSLGAAFVVTGSVNQGCVESGLHTTGRQMLASAGLADVVMAPAADMFELGVEVQVLQRGTMFANRAKRLWRIYDACDSLDAIGPDDRARLEREIFRQDLNEAWRQTAAWWSQRDPNELNRANANPKHKMALLFRSYLGQSSRWAIAGEQPRRMDYQIWCGPAMGAFNSWVSGSFLEAPEERRVVQVARNLLEGAAVITRAQQFRSYGVPIPAVAFDFRPRPLA